MKTKQTQIDELYEKIDQHDCRRRGCNCYIWNLKVKRLEKDRDFIVKRTAMREHLRTGKPLPVKVVEEQILPFSEVLKYNLF